jgi:hypothetical protein
MSDPINPDSNRKHPASASPGRPAWAELSPGMGGV